MAYMKTHATSTVEVHDFSSLMFAWKEYGELPYSLLVGKYIMRGKLTPAQRRHLPKSLLAKLEVV